MGYLVCDKCKGYYELQPGESPGDFSDKCECGGTLDYVERIGSESKSEGKKEETKKEEPKVEQEDTKKKNSVKYCPTCGQPLSSSKKVKTPKKFSTPKIDTSKQKKTASKLFGNLKEHFMGLSTRNKAFSVGGILIVLVLIGVFALPGNIAAAHYNSTNISFDYPSNLEVLDSYTGLDWTLRNKTTAHYAIIIAANPTEFAIQPTTMDEATNPGEVVDEMNQTAYENNRSANNTEPNWFLNQEIKDFEKKYKVTKRSANGYTYYEAKDESNFFYKTIIVKEGAKYFYTIAINKMGKSKPEYYNEAVEGCQMVVNSFKILQ